MEVRLGFVDDEDVPFPDESPEGQRDGRQLGHHRRGAGEADFLFLPTRLVIKLGKAAGYGLPYSNSPAKSLALKGLGKAREALPPIFLIQEKMP